MPPIRPLNRMVIYTTDVTLLVKSVQETIAAIGEIAVLQGGYVAGVENTIEGGLPSSTIRIKVLPERYAATMNQLRGLAIEVHAEKAATQDVTEEYHDLQTQLASLEATHRQLLDLLGRANSTDEVLKIQQQAAQVKLQIDRLRGRATAVERLSELATISAKLQSAEVMLGRDYTAVRGQLRQAQSQYALQLLALKRARTPEEEAVIRDKLAELSFQIDRASARLRELEQKAAQAGFALPAAPQDESAQPVAGEKELPDLYIATRVQLRRAEARQSEITRRLKVSLPLEEQEALRKELADRILEVASLNARLKTIQERAAQIGIVLPSLTAEQETTLAGTTTETTQPDPLRAAATAWEASLAFLKTVLAGLFSAVFFIWWAVPPAILLVITFRRLFRNGRWPGRRVGAVSNPLQPSP